MVPQPSTTRPNKTLSHTKHKTQNTQHTHKQTPLLSHKTQPFNHNTSTFSQSQTVTMASTSTTGTTMRLLAVCLALAFCVGCASAAPTSMPAACLRAATSLCQGSHTSALRCLMDKARSGDAAVPQACTKALEQQLLARQEKQQQGDRRSRALRMLNEAAGGCGTVSRNSLINCTPTCTASGPNQCAVAGDCNCTGYVCSRDALPSTLQVADLLTSSLFAFVFVCFRVGSSRYVYNQ